MVPVVSRLMVYPFKSLDGVSLDTIETGNGSFVIGDRRFALFDEKGKYINGKAEPLVHRLRLSVNGQGYSVFSEKSGSHVMFDPSGDWSEAEQFFSEHFSRYVEIRESNEGRFLDVPVDSAITLVSSSSLVKIAGWMGIADPEELRRRFRATVEVDGADAFWEDCLFGGPGEVIRFQLGSTELECVGPRERCVVPTRNSLTGEVYHAFSRKFADYRLANLTSGSRLNEWGHGYYLCVDCRISPSSYGKTIHLGDSLLIGS